MYFAYFLSILACFGSPTNATHFRGGTITWKPMSNNITAGGTVSIMITQVYSWTRSQIGCNSSMIATQWPPINLNSKAGSGAYLLCNDSCSTSGGYVGNEVPITGYCSDYSAALDLTVSQRSDIVNLTTDANFTATFGANGGWQTLALGSSVGWSLSCGINLHARSDNGLINTPPVATCISYIAVPVNIQQTIQIPVLDADNDFIRCRFANGSAECDNTCPPGSLPSGTSLTSSCALTITGTTAGDYYLVAIQVEDFITNASTTALSSVPLQFLIYIYNNTNCTLKPLLTSDLSSNACQGVQVGTNFRMTLTAINQCDSSRTITDIATLSFPIVIKSALVQNPTNTSLWSVEITWMPTAGQVGSQVFCAVATDSENVQSDQYCVTLFIGLNSVPLCPGATTPPTTMITTQITSEISTEAITSMEITSSSVSSSSPSSTTASPKSPLNWPLIIGLILAALALALCFSLCCCYLCLKTPKLHRRRRKNSQTANNNLEWCQSNGNPYQRFSPRLDGDQHSALESTSRVGTINDLWAVSDVNITRINQRVNPFIDSQVIVRNKQSSRNRPLALQRVQSTLHDSSDSSTGSPSPATNVRTRSVNVTRVSRFPKSSIPPFRHLTGSIRTRTNQPSASIVSVSRVKRSSSVDRIDRVATTLMNID